MLGKLFFACLAAVLAVGLGDRMVGGLSDANMEDDIVQNAVQFATNQHNRGSNDDYLWVMTDVKVQQQVVSGMKYVIKAKMERTACSKRNYVENQVCTSTPQSEAKECTFNVWSRPWITDIQLTKADCKDLPRSGL